MPQGPGRDEGSIHRTISNHHKIRQDHGTLLLEEIHLGWHGWSQFYTNE